MKALIRGFRYDCVYDYVFHYKYYAHYILVTTGLSQGCGLGSDFLEVGGVAALVGVSLGLVLAGREGLSGLGILEAPVLLLVLLVGLDETDLVFLLSLDLVHGQGLVGVGGDDLVGVALSLDGGELPLVLGAVGGLVHLGDGLSVSVVGDSLDLTLLLLVEGETVELIISATPHDEDLVPSLFGVLLESDDLGLFLP